MAIRLGITGGIGSGKSVVAHLLEVMGIPVYISDTETRQLMLTDGHIRQSLTALLGDKVYINNNQLNKPLLASYLFASSDHARQINAIVHPCVKRDFRLWAERHGRLPLVGIESAILIEAGFRSEVDKVLMVYAPVEVRIARVVSRDHTSRQQIEQRICSQMSDEEKRKQADFVIFNDGVTPLIPQVCSLLSTLSGV